MLYYCRKGGIKQVKKKWKQFCELPIAKKIMLIISLVCTIALIIVIPVLAWFSNRREAAIMAKINSPTTLYIYAGGQQEDAAYINLGDIEIDADTLDDESKRYKEYIFCIAGKDVSYYDIQLAHTTNIPFTYELYHAYDVTDSENDTYLADSVEYKSAEIENKSYYYSYGDRSYISSDSRASVKIPGHYLNRTNSGVSDGTIDDKSYDTDNADEDGEKDNVQINAYPVYWQNTNSIGVYREPMSSDLMNKIKSEGFSDYYILRVLWDSNINLAYKETDIVYITARVGSSN